MHNAACVAVLQGFRAGANDLNGATHSETLLGFQHLVQPDAFGIFHGVIPGAAGLSLFVNADDVRVVKSL